MAGRLVWWEEKYCGPDHVGPFTPHEDFGCSSVRWEAIRGLWALRWHDLTKDHSACPLSNRLYRVKEGSRRPLGRWFQYLGKTHRGSWWRWWEVIRFLIYQTSSMLRLYVRHASKEGTSSDSKAFGYSISKYRVTLTEMGELEEEHI